MQQLPAGRDDAFSNRVFELSNNHGRMFGPHRTDAHVFIGAFSREAVDPLRWPGHRYASFNQARDDFARELDRRTRFKSAGFVDLGNAIAGDANASTGDHDGRAVLLRAVSAAQRPAAAAAGTAPAAEFVTVPVLQRTTSCCAAPRHSSAARTSFEPFPLPARPMH